MTALATIRGTTVPFKGNGRKLGYPTANLKISTKLVDGVYFGTADLDSFTARPALIFVGTPTTVGDTERRVEAYLLDIPDRDYYGLELMLDVQYFHRANQTFSSVDELMIAMKSDEASARQWFKTAKS